MDITGSPSDRGSRDCIDHDGSSQDSSAQKSLSPPSHRTFNLMVEPTIRPAELPSLTPSQRRQAEVTLADLQGANHWHGELPVLLLDRCWLRLTVLPLQRLAVVVPPDLSRAAPELERYRQLLADGCSPWQAQHQCWLEFGPEACQQALRRFWEAQDQPSPGWTLQRYLDFLTEYRDRFSRRRPRSLPLLVLARPSGRCFSPPAVEEHGLFWLRPGLSIDEQVMRHTCP